MANNFQNRKLTWSSKLENVKNKNKNLSRINKKELTHKHIVLKLQHNKDKTL